MVYNYFIKISGNCNNRVLGNKGKNLHILWENGFKVPKTYCLTTKAYECFINKSNVGQIIDKALKDKKHTDKYKSHKIVNSILSENIPQEILAELTDHDFFGKQDLKWAIRSSSNLEDLSKASFAGLYDSYLYIEGLANILYSIKKCWASLWNERAIVYRKNNNLNHLQVSMAVIIQEMVDSQYAGVIFTKSPDSENQDEIFLVYCEGIGESLVSGQVTPYSCRINKSSLTIHHVRMPDRKKFADDDIRKLSKLALKVEDHFGSPQDIEWAFDGKTIYLLQTRPISSQIRSEQISMDGIWTRANIGEVLPNVITPLTWAVFRATLMDCPDLALKPSEDIQNTDDGLKRIHGRGYIRVNNFLDSFCYLPFITPKIMSRVLGINLFPEAQSYVRPSGVLVRLAQVIFILNALRIIPRLSWAVRQLPPIPQGELDQLEKIIIWNARCFNLHLKCTAYAIGAFGLLANSLGHWLPSEAESLLPLILIGNENLQTAAQGISLWELAVYVQKNPKLKDILYNNYDWAIIAQYMSKVEGGSQFLTMFQAFLDANGARAAGEFELAVPRWREDPTYVLGVMRRFLYTDPTKSFTVDPAIRRRRQQKAISHIKASLGTFQQRFFTRILNSYSEFTALRENVKYRLIEGYGLLRHIFLKMGNDLEVRGRLQNASDVFFITPSEILALIARDELTHQTTELILKRKAQHSNWQSQDAPDLIIRDSKEDIKPQTGELFGIGCSPGQVEGVARVVKDTSEAENLIPGEILVAPHTDPGWTPLFLSCKAVVTEIGGFLSHGATVAREYGLPAVVNVRGATTRIHTGDLIRVNGTTGQVSLCNQHKGKD
jgi:phosphohistidine swiveling domain-containing protein